MNQRKSLVDPSQTLLMRRQSDLLTVNQSSLYYKSVSETEKNLELMEQIDCLFTCAPLWECLGTQDGLAELGLTYNVKRIRRLRSKIGIDPIYPKKNLLRQEKGKYVHP